MKEIKLNQGRVAYVDDEDYDFVLLQKWYAVKIKRTCVYAICHVVINGKKTSMLMHREIMGNPVGLFIDHIDHNGLNNQKSNLRICSCADNNKHRSANFGKRYMGVGYGTWGKKHYRARINVNGKNMLLGYFYTETDAAIAYNEAAIKYHGEFANLNLFPK